MKKKLFILGAGRGQVGLIRTAKDMGLYTIVATASPNYPGVPIADEICMVDIANPEEVCHKAASLHIDGVATSCLDTGVRALGYTCDHLHLPGLSYNAAIMCNDKYLMKEALTMANVNTARFQKVDTMDSLESAMNVLHFPLIIKATDLQGSRGIFIVRTCEEARKAFTDVMGMTKQSYCIIEEFIEGEEFGAQAFVYNGEVLFVLPHGDKTFMSHTAVPVGHYAPYEKSEEIKKQTEEMVKKAVKAIGLDNCAVNMDLILKDDTVYVIELTGRVGANCLPELVSIYYGIDYYKMIAKCAIGLDPREEFSRKSNEETANLSQMLQSDKGGVLKAIQNHNTPSDSIYEMTFFVKPGDEVRKFTNSNDCIGQVIVKGRDLADCYKIMEKTVSNIEFIIE